MCIRDSFWSISDEPTQNILGVIGASTAAPLILILGWGSFSLPVFLMAWGIRFVCHSGVERAITRMIFFPVAIAFSSAFFATLVPNNTWVHQFGLGGLFGETSVGILLRSIPEVSSISVNTITFSMAIISLLSLLFVSGFSRKEVISLSKFLCTGTFLFFVQAFSLVAMTARLFVPQSGLQTYETLDQKSARSQKIEGILGRILSKLKPAIGKNTPQLVRHEPIIENEVNEKDDRIKSKITSIIRDRVPPLTSQEAVTTSDYSDEKVQTKSFSNLLSPSDRQEPPVSNYCLLYTSPSPRD